MADLERRALRVWEHHGIRCAISGGMFVCGYVQLPSLPMRSQLNDLEAPGGITYGPDEHGWIGFDTGHAGDSWAMDDEPEQIRQPREQSWRALAEALEAAGGDAEKLVPLLDRSNGRRWWTMPRLVAAINQLAEQVAANAAAASQTRDLN